MKALCSKKARLMQMYRNKYIHELLWMKFSAFSSLSPSYYVTQKDVSTHVPHIHTRKLIQSKIFRYNANVGEDDRGGDRTALTQ